MCLLQKMGWKYGEGLGKNSEGRIAPIGVELKVDRKGWLFFSFYYYSLT